VLIVYEAALWASFGELLAFRGVLELGTSGDLHALRSSDLDGLAGTRVTARARRTSGLLDRQISRDLDLLVGPSDVAGNDFEEAVDSRIDVSLAHIGMRSDGIDQFRLVHWVTP